jgi:hypothetical protein
MELPDEYTEEVIEEHTIYRSSSTTSSASPSSSNSITSSDIVFIKLI